MYLIHTSHSSAAFCQLIFASYLLICDPVKHSGDRNGSVGDPSLFIFIRSQSIENIHKIILEPNWLTFFLFLLSKFDLAFGFISEF